MQRADDLGRQLRRPWLGPTNSWRWEVDWTFAQWGVAALTFVLGGILLVWVVPALAVVGGLTVWGAHVASQNAKEGRETRRFRTVIGAVMAGCALMWPDPLMWIKPVFWPISVLASPVLAYYVVKWIGPYVDWNRPLAYWVRLPLRIARGPRLNKPQTIDPTRLLLEAGPDAHERSLEPRIRIRKVAPKDIVRKPVDIVNEPVKFVNYHKEQTKPVKIPRARLISRTPYGIQIGSTAIDWKV